jgi:hypothetical protein
VKDVGWVASDYLGIDQGTIVAMIENYRSELIWKIMQRNPHIRRGLQRAGFSGGWLSSPPSVSPQPIAPSMSVPQPASEATATSSPP